MGLWRVVFSLILVVSVCLNAYFILHTGLLWQFPALWNSTLTSVPGHLKPFGCCRNRMAIVTVDGWLKPADFFEKYVYTGQPVLFKHGAQASPAFARWTDDYFINKLRVPNGSTVSIESGKKEDRRRPTVNMNFKEWVKVYNTTDRYMVHDIPSYLGKDVLLPPSIQCEQLSDMLVTAIVWFSSGGTKSVVHTDSADNINCLFRGEKDVLFVDPAEHGEKVPIDHPEGAYSSIDVDSVDYIKYPGLAETEFFHAHMTAGDCLYIPYKWIHQVNSFGSNLAVNVWWDHFKARELDLSRCPARPDPSLTLDRLRFSGFTHLSSPQDLSNHIIEQLERGNGAMTYEYFLNDVVEDMEALTEVAGRGYLEPVKGMFRTMDRDGDDAITMGEFDATSPEDWEKFDDYFAQYMAIRHAVAQGLQEHLEANEGKDARSRSKSKDEF